MATMSLKWRKGLKLSRNHQARLYAVIADRDRHYYGTQFHPEVVHTVNGAKMLRNFTHNIAGLKGDWTMAAYREEAIEKIRAQVGSGRVICGLSGGVDSPSQRC